MSAAAPDPPGCPRCGSRTAPDGWCPGCYRITAPPAAEPVADPRLPAGEQHLVVVPGTWRRAGPTTCGPLGRVLWTVAVLIPYLWAWFGLELPFRVPVMLVYTFTAVPPALRDIWRRESSLQVLRTQRLPGPRG